MSDVGPVEVERRPVAVVGAGTLGRRIAGVFVAGGHDVHLFDRAPEQVEDARGFVAEHLDEFQAMQVEAAEPGSLKPFGELAGALAGCWMVVEAVPEAVDIKTELFGELDAAADGDAILASNSSSLPSSLFIGKVRRPERVLNTHYQRPPTQNAVELMSCGHTDPAIIERLMERLPRYGLIPFHVLRESDGFIINRIWAAIKRESLMVVQEGVASPETVDQMWALFTASPDGPFRRMDRVGLDVVLAIEEHYAAVRPGIPEAPRELLRKYIAEGRLGGKTGKGFYDAAE